jgi:hypothetical protein
VDHRFQHDVPDVRPDCRLHQRRRELIASSINDGFGASLSPETGAIVFTLIGGGVVCAGTSLVDLFNRFLFSAKFSS